MLPKMQMSISLRCIFDFGFGVRKVERHTGIIRKSHRNYNVSFILPKIKIFQIVIANSKYNIISKDFD